MMSEKTSWKATFRAGGERCIQTGKILSLLAGRSRSSGQQSGKHGWHQKTIGACRTKRPSAGKTAYLHQRSKVRRCTFMKNSECQMSHRPVNRSGFVGRQPVKPGGRQLTSWRAALPERQKINILFVQKSFRTREQSINQGWHIESTRFDAARRDKKGRKYEVSNFQLPVPASCRHNFVLAGAREFLEEKQRTI